MEVAMLVDNQVIHESSTTPTFPHSVTQLLLQVGGGLSLEFCYNNLLYPLSIMLLLQAFSLKYFRPTFIKMKTLLFPFYFFLMFYSLSI